MTQTCSSCQRPLECEANFYGNSRGGFGARCKTCISDANRRTKPWQLYCTLGDHMWECPSGRGRPPIACPLHHDTEARRRQRRLANPESFRAQERKQYQRNPRHPKYQSWRINNPAKWAEYHRKFEANRRGQKRGNFIENVDPQIVYQTHGGMCGICKEYVSPDDFHVDHVIPLSRGGAHGYINVQPAHPACNLRKSAKMPGEGE